MWMKLGVLCVLFMSNFVTLEAGRSSKSLDEVLQCRDENNRPVDWFVMYKIPKIRETSNPQIRAGISYGYMTSETVGKGWTLSMKDITMKTSMTGNTLASLYKDNIASGLMWLMYNDKPPNGRSNANYGHAKGVVVANQDSGFWLIHSVPGFPAIPRTGEKSHRSRTRIDDSKDSNVKNEVSDGDYDYPDSGKVNGQSLMCISVNSNQIDTISRQLMYNQIIVYRKNMPLSLVEKYPIFFNASNEVRIKNPPYLNKAIVRSHEGLEFTSFAKSDKWGRELYDDFVAPQLNSDLYAETWLNGRGKLPSECNGSHVLNVESVNLEVANVVFTSTHDHSKWAVSTKNGKNGNWVCVGDINRADTQYSRGGGTVCLKSPDLWNAYRKSVNDVEPCPKKNIGVFQRFKNWIGSKFG